MRKNIHAASSANFIISSGSACTARAQMGEELELVHRLSWPCLSRLCRWSRQAALASLTTLALALLMIDFLLPPGPPPTHLSLFELDRTSFGQDSVHVSGHGLPESGCRSSVKEVAGIGVRPGASCGG